MALITNKKHLIAFIEGVNGWVKVPGKKLYDKKKLSKVDVQELIERVDLELMPEKLTINGQLTGKTLKMKHDKLKGAKTELETMK